MGFLDQVEMKKNKAGVTANPYAKPSAPTPSTGLSQAAKTIPGAPHAPAGVPHAPMGKPTVGAKPAMGVPHAPIGAKPTAPKSPIGAKPTATPHAPVQAAPTPKVEEPVKEVKEEVKTAPVKEPVKETKAEEKVEEPKVEEKVEEKKATTKKTTSRRSSAKKTTAKKEETKEVAKEEASDLVPEDFVIPRTTLSFDDAVKEICSHFLDEKWEKFKTDMVEASDNIVIEQDMQEGAIKKVISQLSKLREQVWVSFMEAKVVYENLANKDTDGLIDRVKFSNLEGSNETQRKKTGVLAVMNYKTPEGDIINLYEVYDEAKNRYYFLKGLMDTIQFKTNTLITMSGAIKIEKSQYVK